jgi:hypothetical protein
MIIREFLESNNIEFIKQKSFPNCRFKWPLKFDFYLPNQNICIEYDGEQHFKPTHFHNINNKRAVDGYQYMQNNDKIKNDYCLKNDLKLVRIAFFESIEDRLRTEITSLFSL